MRSCQPRASWQNPRVLWQSIAWKVMSPRPWQHAWQWHGITMASQEACASFWSFKLIPCASIVCYAWGRHLCWHLCKTLKLDGWRSTCNQKPGGTKSGKINRGSSSPCSTSVVKIGWYRIGGKIIETVCKLNTVYMILWVAFLALWFIDPFHRHIMYHLWYHRNVCSQGWASRAKPLAHARKRIRAFPVAAAVSDLNFECQALFSHW